MQPVASKLPITLEVHLQRDVLNQSYGFGMGTTENGAKLVTQVTDGTPSDGKLLTADRIVTINGSDTAELSHGETLQLLTRGLRVTLGIHRKPTVSGIRRRGSITAVEPNTRVINRKESVGKIVQVASGVPVVISVTIRRESSNQSYGFGLGSSADGEKVITTVSEGGLSEGQLQTADLIITINTQDANSLSHEEAIAELCSGNEVTLTVERRISGDGLARGSISAVEPAMKIKDRRDSIGKKVVIQVSTPLFFSVRAHLLLLE